MIQTQFNLHRINSNTKQTMRKNKKEKEKEEMKIMERKRKKKKEAMVVVAMKEVKEGCQQKSCRHCKKLMKPCALPYMQDSVR